MTISFSCFVIIRDLSNNELRYLPPYIFRNITAVEFLKMDYNKIERLHEDQFQGLVNLSELYLSENKIEALPDKIFEGVKNLNALNLKYLQHDNGFEREMGELRKLYQEGMFTPHVVKGLPLGFQGNCGSGEARDIVCIDQYEPVTEQVIEMWIEAEVSTESSDEESDKRKVYHISPRSVEKPTKHIEAYQSFKTKKENSC
ncbi:Reticulon-4 receptor [Stylophora pistillata]|uniref:Reticulon-4 receptor n=1 Tax=Stylophora pistillata TaxID=50429 RepID=A0A2B4RCV3_STYPI|nr:Reticulon-4 receptor [Stylophora pistillata]